MKSSFKKLRFLLASGPTREPLDPVRYLSNYSTGTMGRYLAQAIQKKGHALTWVQCPEDAQTAQDLLKRLRVELPKHDVLVMASAVCDVRPAKVSSLKIKKGGLRVIHLIENPDVLQALSRTKKPTQVFVGFALESKDVKLNAMGKLKRKKMELILAQRVTDKQTPFGETHLDAVAYSADGNARIFVNTGKQEIAAHLINQAEATARQKYA